MATLERIDPRSLAWEAWADWAAIPKEERAKVRAKSLDQHRGLFDSLRAALYSPPSEESEKSPETFLEPFSDALLQKASQVLGIAPRSFWPESKPYALCVTHDIDRILATYHRLRREGGSWASTIPRAMKDCAHSFSPSTWGENPFFNFERLRDFEKQLGIRSALYVLFERRRWGRALRRREIQHVLGVYSPKSIASYLAALESDGFEVGIHGSFDAWDSLEAMSRETQRLREMGVREIRGGRNHYLQFEMSSTPIIQARAGLEYDSTLGFNRLAGFRCGTSFPFPIGAGGQLTELSFQLMDTALRFQFQSWKEREEVAFRVLDAVRAQGGVCVVNWHFQFMNPEAFPEACGLLEKIVQRAKADGAWIALPKEVVRTWKERQRG